MNYSTKYFILFLFVITFSITYSMSFDAPVVTIEKDEVIPKDISFNEDSNESNTIIENKKFNNISSVQSTNKENKFSTNSTTLLHPKQIVFDKITPKSTTRIIFNIYSSQGIFTLLVMAILKTFL